ncbi:hypothetical protein SH661x_000487 [Planctomicrobium sp. SH661]|uniref:hypothetical protein n=1 Tax=Planctomicrobium sp. SH661 TaxID=3448124 RepID=UPI003F5C4A58
MQNDDDDDWDDDFPDDSDDYGTVPCPSCGAEIHEDTPRCPICGEYITSSSGRVWEGKPNWYIALALLGIVAVVLAMLRM